jgi:hypothetical protein
MPVLIPLIVSRAELTERCPCGLERELTLRFACCDGLAYRMYQPWRDVSLTSGDFLAFCSLFSSHFERINFPFWLLLSLILAKMRSRNVSVQVASGDPLPRVPQIFSSPPAKRP